MRWQTERAKATSPDEIRKRLRDSLHDRQREFCDHVGKYRAGLCGRRGGKSDAAVSWLIDGGLQSPSEVSPYIALSRSRAVEITGRAFRRIERTTGVSLPERQDNGQVYRLLPNGHRIWLVGCDDKAAIEKLRGDPYRRVVIDEADSMRAYLHSLIHDVLGPCLMDLGGELAMIGTPGPTMAGPFYTATTGDGGKQWPTFRWSSFDNPHLPNARADVQEILDQTGLTWDSPSVRREYFAEWSRDEDAVCYPYDRERNGISGLPDGDYRHTIGIDLGVVDACAFVVGAYRVGHPERYILHAEKHTGMIPTRAAVRLQQLLQRFPRARAIADAGGMGKAYVEEWRQTYGLAVEAAEKLNVAGQIALVAGWLRTAELRILESDCRPLLDELPYIWWNEDRTGVDGHEGDCAAAFRYCCLGMSPNYKPEIVGPAYGSAEWLAEESRKRKELAMSGGAKRRRA